MNLWIKNFRVPDPPEDLRTRVLNAVRNQHPIPELTLADKIWMNRGLRVSWLASVLVLAFFLIVWNPPIHGSSTEEKKAEIPENYEVDPVLQKWLLEYRSHGMFAQTSRNTIHAEDL
jgi:hypothetical protein